MAAGIWVLGTFLLYALHLIWARVEGPQTQMQSKAALAFRSQPASRSLHLCQVLPLPSCPLSAWGHSSAACCDGSELLFGPSPSFL